MQHLLLLHRQHPSPWGGMSVLLEGSSRGRAACGLVLKGTLSVCCCCLFLFIFLNRDTRLFSPGSNLREDNFPLSVLLV